MSILKEISEFLQNGKANEIRESVKKALEEKISAKDILQQGMMDAMSIIGDKFSKNEIFVPDMLIAARAMTAGLEVLKPYLVDQKVENKGTVILGTVKGDLHDIGKNLVKIMLEGKGFEVIDLGIDVPKEKFVEQAQENNAQIIGLSSLLTTTMSEMEGVVKALEDAGIRDKVKVMIGGAPVTDKFREEIGADFYAPNAADAANIALKAVSSLIF